MKRVSSNHRTVSQTANGKSSKWSTADQSTAEINERSRLAVAEARIAAEETRISIAEAKFLAVSFGVWRHRRRE